jgi:5S rRNA maturation endonuclease (ribonuclease M5)
MSKVQYLKKYKSKIVKTMKKEVDGEKVYVPIKITNPILKKKSNQKKGILFADSNEGQIIVGFSLCHSKEDKFDYIKKKKRLPGLGIKIAKERARKWAEIQGYKIKNFGTQIPPDFSGVVIPKTIAEQLPEFLESCNKYYKEENLVPWASHFLSSLEK